MRLAQVPPMQSNSDATIRGINDCIRKHNQAQESTEEGTADYDCDPTYSDSAKGCHFIPKGRMLAFVNAEPIDTQTMQNQANLGHGNAKYTFMHKVFMQQEPAEITMRNHNIGFPKRMTIAFAPQTSPHDESLPWQEADDCIQDMHEWMCKGPLQHEKRKELDGFAQDLRATVAEAVNAVTNRPDKDVPRAWKEKLLCFNTDTLRYSNLAKLKLDYWSQFSRHAEVFGAQNSIDRVAYAMAIHCWLRQVAMHLGLIRFWEQAVRKAVDTRGPHC